MTSTNREALGTSQPPSPSSQTAATSDHSGQSTKSACRVCWRHGCTLETHREYARRAALPPARPTSSSSGSRQSHDDEINFPIEMKANMRQLTQHFFTVEIPRGEVIPHPTGVSRNSDLSRKYASLAQLCPPLCYSIISCAASRIASNQGVVDDRALKHYAHAARSLAETVNQRTTEGSILAALTLVQHDFIFFHTGAIGAHIEGIYSMIQKHGGLAYLDGAIGHLAIFCDYQASVLLDRPPRYRLPATGDTRPLNAPEVISGAAFPSCSVWSLVEDRLKVVLRDVCILIDQLDRSRSTPVTMGDYQFFIFKRNLVENRLAILHAEFQGMANLNECLCLGIIVFQTMTLGGIDTVNGIFDHLIPRFKLAIGDVHIRMGNLWTQEVALAIWLMFIGACIPDAYRKSRKEFLEKAHQMLEATYGNDLPNCKTRVRQGLGRYLWSDLMMTKRFNAVWKELMAMSQKGGSGGGPVEDERDREQEDFSYYDDSQYGGYHPDPKGKAADRGGYHPQ